MRIRRAHSAVIAVGALLVAGTVAPVPSYAGVGVATITVARPTGPYTANKDVDWTVTVKDGTGMPAAGVQVHSAVAYPSRPQCAPATDPTTGVDGTAVVTVTPRCRANLQLSADVGAETTTKTVHLEVHLPMTFTVPTARRPYFGVTSTRTVNDGPGSHTNLVGYRIQRQVVPGKWRTVTNGPLVWLAKAGHHKMRLVYNGDTLYDGFAESASKPTTFVVRHNKARTWLKQFNHFRVMNDLQPVGEDPHKNAADRAHVRYMTKTGQYGHYEDPHNRYYTKLGNEGGTSSNIFAFTPCSKVIPGWFKAPYHGVTMANDRLYTTGFACNGSYAALYVFDNQTRPAPQPRPQWPAAGTRFTLRAFNGLEIPDPLSICPSPWRNRVAGHGRDIGPALFAYPKHLRAHHRNVRLHDNGSRVPVCDLGPDYDAILLLPLYPLRKKHKYTVRFRNDRDRFHWTFRS